MCISKKLRSIAATLTVATLVSQGGLVSVAENYNFKVDNNIQKHIDITEKNSTTYIPLRRVAESLKYDIDWTKSTDTVKVSNGDRHIIVTKGKNDVTVQDVYTGTNDKSKLSGKVDIVNGTTLVSVDMLDIMGVGYNKNDGKKQFDIYTKFLVANVGQDNKFSDKVIANKDMERLNQLTHGFGVKNGVRVEKSDYLDSRSIEDMYDYLSVVPTSEELSGLGYSWGDYLSAGVNKNTLAKLTRLKTLVPMMGIEMEFEPTVYFNIGGKVNLIGGYVNYKGSSIGVNQAYKNYVENYEKVTWKIMKDSDKAFMKPEITKLITEINKSSEMILFLVQDGSVVYMD